MTKRFFKLEDGGATWWFVANDEEHVKQICRTHGVVFSTEDGDEGNIDSPKVDLGWHELDSTAAAVIKTHHDDSLDTKPLADRELGDFYCSEY